MRLTRYLAEGRTQLIEFDDVWKLLETKHSKAYVAAKKGIAKILRGVQHVDIPKDAVGYVQPRKFTRKSANTSNWYTQIVSNSKLWKKYPRRDKSIICTNDYMTAAGYGSEGIFLVLPENNGRVGVCPEDDFWNSFGEFAPDRVNAGIGDLINQMSGIPELRDSVDVHPLDADKNIKETNKLFNMMNHLFKNPPDGIEFRHSGGPEVNPGLNPEDDDFKWEIVFPWVFEEYKIGEDFRKFIEYKFSPDVNGFGLVKAGEPIRSGEGLGDMGNELWTDAPSLMIRTIDAAGFDIKGI
jgi:hypothetical protein